MCWLAVGSWRAVVMLMLGDGGDELADVEQQVCCCSQLLLPLLFQCCSLLPLLLCSYRQRCGERNLGGVGPARDVKGRNISKYSPLQSTARSCFRLRQRQTDDGLWAGRNESKRGKKVGWWVQPVLGYASQRANQRPACCRDQEQYCAEYVPPSQTAAPPTLHWKVRTLIT